jgi:hypothetical protein
MNKKKAKQQDETNTPLATIINTWPVMKRTSD